jgi:SAM-dependent methyltransferase
MVCSKDMTPGGEIHCWHRYVPSACSDEDVNALRALLARLPETAISNVPNPAGDPMPGSEELPATLPRPPFDGLIGLFQECLYVNDAELPDQAIDLLDRLGLIGRDPRFEGLVFATVAILRVAGELTVCDWDHAADGSDQPLPPDFVFPPVFDNTLRYLANLPSTPCEAMLELGTGSGIAAIMGARHARRVWATDITSRAVHFASLSCRLAGLDNVTVLEGDLYSPVEGLTFDRIAFHPPWVPRSQGSFAFGDGGDDGETIIRRSIEGLPRFLRPGGRFYAMLLGSDRQGERFEQRVRHWLGAAEDQFDIAVAEVNCVSPNEFLAHNLASGSICERDIPLWTELWKATRTEAIVYGHLIVERHEDAREPATARGPSWIPDRV